MSSERRRLSSPLELRALSHPTRLALLELLDQDGPMTATQAGERIGESPASCSFHLRTLARYGYVEEAPGGRGRQRPWRAVPQLQEIREIELEPEARIAAGAFLQLLRDRDHERLRRWEATRAHYPAEWRAAAAEMRAVLYLTAAELDAIGDAFDEVLQPYGARDRAGERPPGALPVSIGIHGVPLRPPAGTTEPAEPAEPAEATGATAPTEPTGPAGSATTGEQE